MESVEEQRETIYLRIRAIMDALDEIEHLETRFGWFVWKFQDGRTMLNRQARDSYVKEVLALREILKQLDREAKNIKRRQLREHHAETRGDARRREKAFRGRTRKKLDGEAKDQLTGDEGMSDQDWAAISQESEENLRRWRDAWRGNPSRANLRSFLDAAATVMYFPEAPDSESDAIWAEMFTALRGILNGAIALYRKNPNKANARRLIRRAEEAASLGIDINFMIDTWKEAASQVTRPRARARK